MLNGAWPRSPLGQGGEIAGRTMGLIGYGSIAQIVAQKANALGMDILAYDPFLPNDHLAWGKASRAEIDDLLQNADVISLHVPLTPETENLIDQAALARMKKSAVLINTARGGIVDENALVGTLRSVNISGAALDVFAQEPLTEKEAQKFIDCPNLILTPHIGGVTYEANIRVSCLTVANVKQHLMAGAK
jgi:(S)-sulfolactate dehydrogenase